MGCFIERCIQGMFMGLFVGIFFLMACIPIAGFIKYKQVQNRSQTCLTYSRINGKCDSNDVKYISEINRCSCFSILDGKEISFPYAMPEKRQ